MRANELGRGAIKVISSFVNLVVLIAIVLLFAFAGYALWDTKQLHNSADKAHYAVYKPTAEDGGASFEELRVINPEVIAWLTVYGTNIDYPVTQSEDNMKYINTNAEGQYSLTGAIFLGSGYRSDFFDFECIVYGHHMEGNVMFGEITKFADRTMFDAHRYGNLYFDGTDHGIEFFAFVHADAYDGAIFTETANEAEAKQTFLEGLLSKALYQRDIGVTLEDHIILLSTCSSDSTNGRDILVGRITKEVFENSFVKAETSGQKGLVGVDIQSGPLKEFTQRQLIISLALSALLPLLALAIHHKRNRSERKSR